MNNCFYNYKGYLCIIINVLFISHIYKNFIFIGGYGLKYHNHFYLINNKKQNDMIFIIILLLIIAIIIANAMISKAIFDAEIKQYIDDLQNELLKDKE